MATPAARELVDAAVRHVVEGALYRALKEMALKEIRKLMTHEQQVTAACHACDLPYYHGPRN